MTIFLSSIEHYYLSIKPKSLGINNPQKTIRRWRRANFKLVPIVFIYKI